ncbi:hypothetical protein [Sphingorhabdus sp.]|uniref:hypothetical protein n=1 Tax=Sphingorhabdus sp. TaxID=1902408 RepID=UPI003D816152
MIINPNFPGGFVTFCDDIRHEVTGKMTLVGTYQSQINVMGSSPVVLAQLCALIDFRFKADSLPMSPKIFVFRSDEVEPIFSMEGHIPANEETLFEDISDIEGGSVRFHQMIVPVLLHGIAVTESFRLKVRAFVGDDEIRLGSLKVNLMQSEAEESS